MSTYSAHKSPHVTYVPTLTGGIGTEELQRFYSEFFINCNPPSLKLTLLSRTIGADRLVDEMHVAFKHTQEMPWILPGIPPTNKRVEILVVSIVTVRGGKLYHEHIYWDQASVLVQVGLLDPKVVPQKASENGVKKLPVVGKEAARRVLRGYDQGDEGEATNELIPEWDDGDDIEDDVGEDANKKTGGSNEKKAEKAKADADADADAAKPEPEKVEPEKAEPEKIDPEKTEAAEVDTEKKMEEEKPETENLEAGTGEAQEESQGKEPEQGSSSQAEGEDKKTDN